MKRTRFFICVLIALLLCCMTTAGYAASVTYDGTAQDFVFAPGSENSPTDLFEDLKEVMPGDVLTQQITVKNDAGKNVDVKLYVRSLGAQEGTEDILAQMNLKVLNGSEELFDAPASETAQMTDWVPLGTFKSGSEITLDLELEVPITLGNDAAGQIAYLDWEFKAEEIPTSEEPKTGDNNDLTLWLIIAAAAAVLIVLLIVIFRKLRREE